MSIEKNTSFLLMSIIGSPFVNNVSQMGDCKDIDYEKLYAYAWENRVELLFLRALEKKHLLKGFEDRKEILEKRSFFTRKVAADASKALQASNVDHIVFKSIKPFPATPNDVDIVCLGNKKEYQKGLNAFYNAGFKFIEKAPMQTVLYHPLGEGKVGPKKKGGTWYIDFYRGVATDYYEYINKESLSKYRIERDVEGQKTILLTPEPELAIVLFHNVFPEKTCHLEHLYLCLFALIDSSFDLNKFIQFSEDNCLERGIKANLTVFEALHKKVFGVVPEPIEMLLDRWGRNKSIQDGLSSVNYNMKYIFSGAEFWKVFFSKQREAYSRKSLIRQCVYMLNPVCFLDTLRSALVRTFSKDNYGHE